MRLFATGVTIVTTRLGDQLHGMTANAFTSLSLEPLLVLICVDKAADTHDILKQSGVFAVNILDEEQGALADQFARKESQHDHRIERLAYSVRSTGAPILAGCLAYADCRIIAEYPGGDHTIFVGRVEEADADRKKRPLIFYQGRYQKLAE